MKREIIKTADGSTTIFLPEWNEHYHSKHGAVQEANHVFLKTGLQYYISKHHPENLNILEIGFGTGLNALITALAAEKMEVAVAYTGVEAYPVSSDELMALNYSEAFQAQDVFQLFEKLHLATWEKEEKISSFFRICKQKMFFSEITSEAAFDLIFFDAFGPRVQPELWSEEIFNKMFRALRENGVLVTYSAKGSVRRAMQAVGFEVERLPGPPGKREMLRATRH